MCIFVLYSGKLKECPRSLTVGMRVKGNKWCKQWYGIHTLQNKSMPALSNKSRNILSCK